MITNHDAGLSTPEVLLVPLAPAETKPNPQESTAQEGMLLSGAEVQQPTGVMANELRTASGLPPKGREPRFQSLDIVRGMACLMLVLYHASFYAEHSWSTGDRATWSIAGLGVNLIGRLWMGVPMFFVVSGYCIAASIDSLRRKPHSLSNYFYRRFRRIYPPLWASLGLAIGFTCCVGLRPHMLENCLQLPQMAKFTPWDWFSNFTASTSWLPKLVQGEGQYLLRNTWTLCYEEQFYFVTGFLLIAAARRFFLAAYLVAFATILIRHVCRTWHVPTHGFFFDGHWLLFVSGILLYQRINYLRGKQAWAAISAFGLGVLYGLAERILSADPVDRHLGEYILVACSFSIFLMAIKPWDSKIVELWILQPLRWCGKISYSIYLTHFPITVLIGSLLAVGGTQSDAQVLLVTVPLCVAISLPIAWSFYMLVERHFVNSPAK